MAGLVAETCNVTSLPIQLWKKIIHYIYNVNVCYKVVRLFVLT